MFCALRYRRKKGFTLVEHVKIDVAAGNSSAGILHSGAWRDRELFRRRDESRGGLTGGQKPTGKTCARSSTFRKECCGRLVCTKGNHKLIAHRLSSVMRAVGVFRALTSLGRVDKEALGAHHASTVMHGKERIEFHRCHRRRDLGRAKTDEGRQNVVSLWGKDPNKVEPARSAPDACGPSLV